MWNVTPDQPLGCDGCGRQIAPGEPCISDLPQHLPKNVNRRDYRHFHLESPHHNQADATPSSSCYREFATQRVSEQAKEELVCLGCGHLILNGEEYLQEFLFVRDDGKNADDFESEPGPAALVASLLRSRQVKPGSFAGLSSQTVRKFQRAGLSNGRGTRSHTATQEFYRTSIPGPVRNLGEEAVKRFTQGKEASHIRSVANAPGQVRNPANIVWESAKANAKRRSRNMTPKQVVGAKAVNAADTFKIVGRAAGKNAGKGAAFAALFEFPVSLVENGISICRGKKSRREAAKDTGKVQRGSRGDSRSGWGSYGGRNNCGRSLGRRAGSDSLPSGDGPGRRRHLRCVGKFSNLAGLEGRVEASGASFPCRLPRLRSWPQLLQNICRLG